MSHVASYPPTTEIVLRLCNQQPLPGVTNLVAH